ncbi:hypothetical protein MKX03_037389, partial [Papaver bracteatum]
VGAPAHVGIFAPIDVVVTPGNTIEIITHVELIKKGEKVGSSEAALLANPEVLDITDKDLMGKFVAGVSMVTSLSLVIAYSTLATAPHIFINAYKNLLADPSKFAAAASGSAADIRIFRSFVAALFMVPFTFPLGFKLWER